MLTESSTLVDQKWETYTDEDHAVWGLLYDRRMRELESTGSQVFLNGARAIGLSRSTVPDLSRVNQRLEPMTGWSAVPVSGFIPAADFFGFLARRRFPTTITVRPRAQLEYLPEPDIFHDVFGHVPLHADTSFGAFLQRFGAVARKARTEEETTWMARLFWFTVEFGLVRERGAVRVYGSGLISSAGDAANALSDRCDRRDFDLDRVIAQPFEIDQLQPILYVVDSFDQLFDAVRTMEERLAD